MEKKTGNEPECYARAASYNTHFDVIFHFALFRGTSKLCVHRKKKNVLLASMKVIFPLSALTFFLFLEYLTHPGKRDGKSLLVFYLFSCFLFSSLTKILTLHSKKIRFYFSLWILVFLNKSCSFSSLNGKKKFTTLFENKRFGLHRGAGKVDRQKLFHFLENINKYSCHGNLYVGTLRASVLQFFSL